MRYEPAANPPRGDRCQSGTLALAQAIRNAYPELQCMEGPYGCYNRRLVAGTRTWSLHAEGRALDVGMTDETRKVAWILACELVGNRTLYGIMRVILDRHIWSTETPKDWRRLGHSSDQHLDHVHVEQFRQAASRPPSVAAVYTTAMRRSRT